MWTRPPGAGAAHLRGRITPIIPDALSLCFHVVLEPVGCWVEMIDDAEVCICVRACVRECVYVCE